MIPRLYESEETEFTTFGICPLPESISCLVTEGRNGQYTLEMEYPRSGMWFSEIKADRIILATAHDRDDHPQAFRIERIEGTISDIVTIYAVHISYQLNWIILKKMTKYTRYAELAMSQMKRDALMGDGICPFNFYSDIGTEESTPVYISTTEPTPFRSYLGGIEGSVLDTYGGEYEWDMWDVHLWQSRGEDNGVKIVYGKNLTGIDWETDLSETYTGAVAYYKSEDEEGQEVYVEGDVQTILNNTFAFHRIIVLDVSSEYESTPTKAQLNTYASNYVNANSVTPTVSFTLEFVPLWQTEEYKEYADFERVKLCDTVHIVYPPLGIELDAKVVKTVYNVLLDRYDSIEVSTVRKNLSTTIFAMQKEIKRLSISWISRRRLTR